MNGWVGSDLLCAVELSTRRREEEGNGRRPPRPECIGSANSSGGRGWAEPSSGLPLVRGIADIHQQVEVEGPHVHLRGIIGDLVVDLEAGLLGPSAHFQQPPLVALVEPVPVHPLLRLLQQLVPGRKAPRIGPMPPIAYTSFGATLFLFTCLSIE
jgi:hypothetical protein